MHFQPRFEPNSITEKLFSCRVVALIDVRIVEVRTVQLLSGLWGNHRKSIWENTVKLPWFLKSFAAASGKKKL